MTASERFAGTGYHRTSLAQIAEAVGVTEGGLLYHFPSKRHLLLAVAEHRIETIAGWWSELSPRATFGEVLDALVATTGRFLQQPGLIELSVLAVAEAADPSGPAHEVFAARYREAVGGLAAAFGRCAERGELAPDVDCVALARECIAVSDGLQLQWVLTAGDLDLAAAIRHHVDRVARSAASPTASAASPTANAASPSASGLASQ
ncbi:TetR/AcrR family transcriptional regulator [Actinoplanes derwentensis]|uniref:DNA-binding transcriptional regulator, AcrR family n=1 Tax=Actinoplanes derwentensis TaxID=113562 RepID=A0A1H2D7K2_9ACTN|nr:TetR/AcrR family transcriptional regulator [Actinoplanes derwentensis]GID89391.1 TetR family transcriptional regulator [Actinoplanes derwentensis]SDT78574.1 DNA-binding transcriptional regulator, AcrR family [Actinoplanes derwentensis]